MDAIVLSESEGEVIGAPPRQLRILAEGQNHAVAVLDTAVPPGFPGPVLHRHARMTDIFYVLDGTLQFDLEGERRTLGPGGFVLVPPGVAHTFANPGPKPARFLNMYQPAGLEQYVKDVAVRMASGQPPSPAEMAEMASGQDFEAVTAGTG